MILAMSIREKLVNWRYYKTCHVCISRTQFSNELRIIFGYRLIIFDLIQLWDDTREATVAVRRNDISFQSKRSKVSFQCIKIDRFLRIVVQNICTFRRNTSEEENR